MWVYHSPIGDIYIKQLEDGRFGMIYNGIVWESCETAEAQADNVYMQCTGCSEWDCYNIPFSVDIPCDLSEWEVVRF